MTEENDDYYKLILIVMGEFQQRVKLQDKEKCKKLFTEKLKLLELDVDYNIFD